MRLTPAQVYDMALAQLREHQLDDSGLCVKCRISPCRPRREAQAAIQGFGAGELRPPYDPPPPARDDLAERDERAYRALLEYERLAEGQIWPASNSGG